MEIKVNEICKVVSREYVLVCDEDEINAICSSLYARGQHKGNDLSANLAERISTQVWCRK